MRSFCAGLLAPEAAFEQAEEEQQEQACTLCEQLGGLPLALDQAGAYIEETGCSLVEYQHLFEGRRADLLARRGGVVQDHPLPVATTWSLSFQRVEEQNPVAADLLRFFAFLSPDAIVEELLTVGASSLGPVLAPVAVDVFSLNQAIEPLRAYSLVRRDPKEKTLSIHRLVQAVLQDTLEEAEKRTWAERAMLVVNLVFPEVEYDVKHDTWPQCERLLTQALFATQSIKQYQIIEEQAGRLFFKTAIYLREHARYAEAEPLFQHALHIWEQVLGPKHPQVAVLLRGWAGLYSEQRKYTQAEPLFKRAHSIWEQQLVPDYSAVASLFIDQACFYINQGKYAEAELLYQRARYVWEQMLGPQHLAVTYPLNGLADLFCEQGEYAQAEPLYQQVLHIREQELGPEHPDVAVTLDALAVLYCKQGEDTKAEPLFLRALHIREQALGPEHPAVASSLNNLANLYWLRGEYAQAGPLYQRALHIWQQRMGPQYPQETALNNLAEIYRWQGRGAEAEPLYQRALHIWQQQLGLDHAQAAYPLRGLADLYYQQEKYVQARPLYQQALRIGEQQWGPQHPETAEIRKHFIVLLRAMGQYEEAVQLEALQWIEPE